jgi:tetratricopeptide (TPR) repeat protein
MYLPEDENQALVETPYGQGTVIRTRNGSAKGDPPKTREIELLNWTKPNNSKSPARPTMLYSPNDFPSIQATVGSEVITLFGRGKVEEIRADEVLVVRISSWRLGGRSYVTCFLSQKSVQVVRPKKIYQMTVFEKVEHAQHLKEKANHLFSEKEYSKALKLYAEAVDAVRYVQHMRDSTNEVRADLLVVMITCCNNAATCGLHLKDWERAQKFGKNALVLLEALHEKRENSNILKLLNREGTSHSKIFGAWMAKSYQIIARGLTERGNTNDAIGQLKNALDCLSSYKQDGDVMLRQLQTQEKEIRKILAVCKERLKVERMKEKQRARAMFGSAEEKKDGDSLEESHTGQRHEATEKLVLPRATARDKAGGNLPTVEEPSKRLSPSKKRVSFADGTSPGDEDIDKASPGDKDTDVEPSFFDDHKEALYILGGIALSSMAVRAFFRHRR